MKIICNRQELSDATANVQGAVTTSAIPALEGILFSAQDQSLKLSGYSQELGITTAIHAQVDKPGEIVLNAKLFYEIVRKLPGDLVHIEVDEKLICSIRCGDSDFSILGIAAEEFPELPTVAGGSSVSVDNQIFKNMVRQTRFAVAKNDAKPVHMGILFELTEEYIRLVAVDGYRLAMRTEQMKNDLRMTFIVPEKTLSEIIKLIGEEEETVNISVGKRHIIFEVGNYLVVSRLLDGDFLDYKTAIPQTHTTSIIVSTRSLIDCIERISLLITDRLKSPVRCIFDEDMIKASCTTTIGSAHDKISCRQEGNRIEIGFNNRFLVEALRASECDEIRIELSGSLAPMVIKPVEGDDFLFLVLPVRLKAE